MVVAGTISVSHCSGGSTSYEIPMGQVVSHEMGHCFGLVHTRQSGGDGISDTSVDYVQNNECVNPNTAYLLIIAVPATYLVILQVL